MGTYVERRHRSHAAAGRRGPISILKTWLPRGDQLPTDQWLLRHRGLTALLWVHVPVVPLVGFFNGRGLEHSILESIALAVMATVASSEGRTRRTRMVATTLGLITASALLVHFSGGLIEMHFHFFIMVAAVTLYQSWFPFLAAIIYVVAHHGIIGTLYPTDVFNHPAALAQPWKWAAVHGFFIAGASAIGLLAWRFNERSQQAVGEQKLRSLVESLPTTFYRAEPGSEGRWAYVSPQIETLLGVTPEEWLADPKNWYKSIHHEDRERVMTIEQQLMESGGRQSTEYRLQDRDGAFVWVRDEMTVVRDEAEAAKYLQGFMLDISDRKQAELEAQRTEAHRKAIISGALDAVIVADLSGKILEFNPAAEHIFGYTRQEAVGRDLADTIIPPSLRPAHRAGLTRYVETGESKILRQRVEVEGLRSNGSVFPVELSITHDQSEGKDVLVAFARDITDRKVAAEQLASQTQRQAALMELGHKALSSEDVTDLLQEGVELVGDVLNVDLCQVFDVLADGRLRLRAGYGWPEALIGQATVAGGPGSQAGHTIGSDGPVVVDDYSHETRFKPSPALLLDEDVTSGMSVLINGSGGQPFGVLGAHTKHQRTFEADDVSFLQAVANIFSTAIQRKEAEDSRGGLEDQLALAQKMEAIGHLAGGIAHDFNNLLAVIRGYTTFVADVVDEGDPMQDDLKEILNATEKGTNLVRQLLTFSRREAIRLEVLDVNAVILDVTRMLQRTLSENIRLQVETSATAPHAEIDRGHLEQILVNLVVNAKDAMSNGGLLAIRSSNLLLDESAAKGYGLAPGAYVCISVSDDGTGIPEDIRSSIFDPFFTTKEKRGGTGLGLATVYGIAKRAGGEISVYSEEGLGTTFRVYLPEAVAEASAVSQKEPQEVRHLDGDETILVVEDEEALRALVERLLREHGYDVLSTTSPIEALRLAENRPVDLLLTDVVMPELSGWDLAQTLGEKRRIKAVFMSGYTDELIGKQGLVEAGETCLQKPFGTRELLLKVREALDAA